MADMLSSDKLGRQLLGVDREVEALKLVLGYKKPGGVNFNRSEERERKKQEKKLERLISLRRQLIAQMNEAQKRNAISAQDFPGIGKQKKR